jgi:hypothetical protein
MYSGRKITPSFGYVTVSGEGKMERAMGSKMAKSLCILLLKKFPLLILTQPVAF